MVRLPEMSCIGVTSMGSDAAPITMSLPFGPRPSNQLGHRFRAWGCRENDLCAAQFLQCLCCVRRFAIDVHARSEFLCERRVFRPAPDRRDLIAKLVRELNSEVTQTADTQHRHKVAGHGAAVPQRVVRW